MHVTQKIVVLIADDDPDTRNLLRYLLEVGQFGIIEVADGKELVERARAEHPMLMIVDVMMPKLDGFQAVKTLRKDPAFETIPVLFISCIVRNEPIVVTMKQMPHAVFMEKPFAPATLLDMVRTLISQTGHSPNA